jgi:7-cyano-7-deazaguanine reductase
MEIPELPACARKPASPTSRRCFSITFRTRTCVELKSLKLYIWSFRNTGCFHEDVTNRILDDLASATKPRYMR